MICLKNENEREISDGVSRKRKNSGRGLKEKPNPALHRLQAYSRHLHDHKFTAGRAIRGGREADRGRFFGGGDRCAAACVPVLRARTRVETAAHARRAGETTFFRHHAMTARTGAGILAAASLDARRRAAPLPFGRPLLLMIAPRGCSLVVTRSGVAATVRCSCCCLWTKREGGREGEAAELRVLVRYGSFIGLGAADGCCCSEFPALRFGWVGGRACSAFYPVAFARSAGRCSRCSAFVAVSSLSRRKRSEAKRRVRACLVAAGHASGAGTLVGWRRARVRASASWSSARTGNLTPTAYVCGHVCPPHEGWTPGLEGRNCPATAT